MRTAVLAAVAATAATPAVLGQLTPHEPVDILVGLLRSFNDPGPGLDFYTLPMCRPNVVEQREDHVLGRTMQTTGIRVDFMRSMPVTPWCTLELTRRERDTWIQLIDRDFRTSMYADGLLGSTTHWNGVKSYESFRQRIGGILRSSNSEAVNHYINNHFRFFFGVNSREAAATNVPPGIVEFSVEVMSVNHTLVPSDTLTFEYGEESTTDDWHILSADNHLNNNGTLKVQFTYEVIWRASGVAMANRWEMILHVDEGAREEQWSAIGKSLIVGVLVYTALAGVFVRVFLPSPPARANSAASSSSPAAAEAPWRDVAHDVYRPPTLFPSLFAAMLGAGLQTLFMVVFTLLLSCVEFVEPSHKRNIAVALGIVWILLVFVFVGLATATQPTLFSSNAERRLMQLLAVLGLCAIFPLTVHFSPPRSVWTAMAASWVAGSFVGGYVQAYVMVNLFRAKHQRGAFLAFVFVAPTLIGALLLAGSLIRTEFGYQYNSSIPRGVGDVLAHALFAVGAYGCSALPLAWAGASFGARPHRYFSDFDMYDDEHAQVSIPRDIPPQPWYLNMFATSLISGAMCLSTISIQADVAMRSMWLDSFYESYAYLAAGFVGLLATVSATSILVCFAHLSARDYRWWWRSMWSGGATGVLFLAFAMSWYSHWLVAARISTHVLFFTYALGGSVLLVLLTAAVGHLACAAFVARLYGPLLLRAAPLGQELVASSLFAPGGTGASQELEEEEGEAGGRGRETSSSEKKAKANYPFLSQMQESLLAVVGDKGRSSASTEATSTSSADIHA